MDIKHAPKKYALATGLKPDMKKIKASVKMIMNSGIPYEFRTTAVPGIHNEEDFKEIAKWIKGARAYYLQEFRPLRVIDDKVKKTAKENALDLKKVKKEIAKDFLKFGIRENN
jgi:pyruvate formate lyase activating enzyme